MNRFTHELFQQLCGVVSSNRSARAVSTLCTAKMWEQALAILDRSVQVGIVTGFYIVEAAASETDGPPGAVALAKALMAKGKQVRIGTDSLNLVAVTAAANSVQLPVASVQLLEPNGWSDYRPDVWVFIERLGRAANGKYYNMRGQDVSAYTEPLDHIALYSDTPVIAIGDGGNEVGMGNFGKNFPCKLSTEVDIRSIVRADVTLPVDISNWGGYALAALLSHGCAEWVGHTADQERRVLETLQKVGAVDGVTLQPSLSVDGVDVEEHSQVVEQLRSFFDSQSPVYRRHPATSF